MGWLLLLAAVLAFIFPPLAILVLALLITGVFAKGIQADADPAAELQEEKRRNRRRWARLRERSQPPADVIDVQSYPVDEEE
jgi:hypothetical protein